MSVEIVALKKAGGALAETLARSAPFITGPLIRRTGFSPARITATPYSTVQLSNNSFYLVPFRLGRDMTITRVRFNVATAQAGSTVTVALWAVPVDGSFPWRLIANMDVDTTSTGVKLAYLDPDPEVFAGEVLIAGFRGNGATMPTLTAFPDDALEPTTSPSFVNGAGGACTLARAFGVGATPVDLGSLPSSGSTLAPAFDIDTAA